MRHMLIHSYYVMDVTHIRQPRSTHDPNGGLEKEAPVGGLVKTTKAEV